MIWNMRVTRTSMLIMGRSVTTGGSHHHLIPNLTRTLDVLSDERRDRSKPKRRDSMHSDMAGRSSSGHARCNADHGDTDDVRKVCLLCTAVDGSISMHEQCTSLSSLNTARRADWERFKSEQRGIAAPENGSMRDHGRPLAAWFSVNVTGPRVVVVRALASAMVGEYGAKWV